MSEKGKEALGKEERGPSEHFVLTGASSCRPKKENGGNPLERNLQSKAGVTLAKKEKGDKCRKVFFSGCGGGKGNQPHKKWEGTEAIALSSEKRTGLKEIFLILRGRRIAVIV